MIDKSDLAKFKDLLKEIEHLKGEKAKLYAKIGRPIYPDGMPHGTKTPDPTAAVGNKLVEYDRRIAEKVAALVDERFRIEEIISTLPPRERKLIRLRYIEGLPWWRVGQEMHYSEQHVRLLHDKIISK